jgi:hypothetical protein
LIKAILASGLLAVGVAVGAPTLAHADSESYIDYLARHGENVAAPDVQLAAVDLGYATCDLYRTADNREYVRGHLNSDAVYRNFSVGAVLHLCPDLMYLLP